MTGHGQQQLRRACSSSLLTLQEFYLSCFLIEQVNPKASVSKVREKECSSAHTYSFLPQQEARINKLKIGVQIFF